MIRWCSYCQRYIGEIPPFDDYSLTHGICEHCETTSRWRDDSFVVTGTKHRRIYEHLRDAVRTGSIDSTRLALDAAFEQGLEPVDLAIGMLQPILREIGDLWATGEVSVATEHAATYAVTEMMDHPYARRPDYHALREGETTDVLLVPAPGNDHVLGAQVTALFLHALGIRCGAAPLALTADQIVALVRVKQPRILGLSIAMPEQLRDVEAVWRALLASDVHPKPFLVVGGYPLRCGLEVPAESPFIAARDVADLQRALRLANLAFAANTAREGSGLEDVVQDGRIEDANRPPIEVVQGTG